MNENGKIYKTQKQQNNKKMLPAYILARLGGCFFLWSTTVIPWVFIPGVWFWNTYAHYEYKPECASPLYKRVCIVFICNVYIYFCTS